MSTEMVKIIVSANLAVNMNANMLRVTCRSTSHMGSIW